MAPLVATTYEKSYDQHWIFMMFNMMKTFAFINIWIVLNQLMKVSV